MPDKHPEAGPPSAARNPMRVLIVEDNADQREIIALAMRASTQDFEISEAGTLAQARVLLAEQTFDCVLLDHHLPDGVGYELMADMEDRLLTTPVIALSANNDPAVAIADFRSGCVDFICKSEVLRGSLRERVIEALARARRKQVAAAMRHETIQHSQEELIDLARVDSLTQIFNRAVFDDYVADLAVRAARGTSFAMLLIDVDNFKRYNDNYGHQSGDTALRAVASALSGGLRKSDFLARYGGEEFVVVLEGVSADQLRATADRLVRCVSGRTIPHAFNDGHGVLTISVGGAVAPHGCADTDAVLEAADKALFAAKLAGKNTWRMGERASDSAAA